MARHALGRNAKFARAIGRLGASWVVVVALTTDAAYAAPAPRADDRADPVERLLPLLESHDARLRRDALVELCADGETAGRPLDVRLVLAIADSVLDRDLAVATLAEETLRRRVLTVGEPIEIVASWARELAPGSRFARGVASALREADRRWPADALLPLIDAEGRADERAAAPALPGALLDLAAALLRPQATPVAPRGARTPLRKMAPPPPAPPPPLPTAVVPEALLARLRATDPAIVADAFEEFERTTSGRPLPAALLPTLVQLALHGPDSVRKRAVWRFTDALDADPAPLAEYWRARHAVVPNDAARLALLVAAWGERALPVLETIAAEGDREDRTQVLKVFADRTTPFGQGPLGDALLLATIRHDGDAHDPRLVAALARALVRLGPAAVEPLALAFDRATDVKDRVELAAALLALGVRRDEALAVARDALGSREGAVRREAWIVLARAHGLDVDDAGVVRPG
jgi:hypothetical protein